MRRRVRSPIDNGTGIANDGQEGVRCFSLEALSSVTTLPGNSERDGV
jgi:hypothetical protein